jgi:hypothetical protein
VSHKLLEAFKSINLKDLAARAGWTFLQSFVAVFLLVAEDIVEIAFTGDWTSLYALLIPTTVGAIAAGLSALKTVILEVVRDLKARS